ncbi:hypothetical protein GYB59_06090 [bacterium]|nr:hypothetical protein [bacterium]
MISSKKFDWQDAATGVVLKADGRAELVSSQLNMHNKYIFNLFERAMLSPSTADVYASTDLSPPVWEISCGVWSALAYWQQRQQMRNFCASLANEIDYNLVAHKQREQLEEPPTER